MNIISFTVTKQIMLKIYCESREFCKAIVVKA